MKKAFDQTVRDLKREVNKKVLKVPGIEQKILDATSNEPWGPHGSHLADIAQATRNYHEYQMIMHVMWKRLNDTGKNWRHVYKALTVLEYLVGHGSERVIDEVREHAYQISTLSDFQYIDSSGRDQGSNVRRKSQSLVALVNDKERIQEVRQKAVANRDKFRSTYSQGGRSPYGDRYDEDRYEGRYRDSYDGRSRDSYRDSYEGRYKDEDRSGSGRDREWGSRDDERYGRGSDSYNRDGDRYGRDSNERYGRDSYRDDDYRGRGSDDFQFGPRSRSLDRDRDRYSEEDDRYSSRNNGSRIDEPSQDDRQLERKLSGQSTPPSYEAAAKAAHDQVQDGRGVGNVAPSATKAYLPPAAKASSSTSTSQEPSQSMAGVSASASNKEGDDLDEFDPRGSMPATAAPASGSGLDLFGNQTASDSIDSLALVPVSYTTTYETDVPANSGAGTNFVPLSSASNASGQRSEDPFGDGPFRATAQDNFQAQQQGLAPATSFQPFGTVQGAEPPASAATTFDFGDPLGGLTYTPDVANGHQHFAASSSPMASEFLVSQANNSAHGGVPPQQFQQPAFPTNMHTPNSNCLPQPGPSAVLAPQPAAQPAGASYPQPAPGSYHTQPGLSSQPTQQTAPVNYPTQPSLSSQPAPQTALATPGQPAMATPQKGKFETKSTVWADTLNRGLVNLNISGAKVNPLADIGVDFEAINRMDKRKEKSSAAPITSTITMGKAMGSGSGMGRAGAGGVAPLSNAMMGSGMGMGMGAAGGMGRGMGMGVGAGPGMGMGGYGGGMNQPMGMNGGMGMGMNMGMNPGAQMRPPAQGPGMPGVGYNPMMGTGMGGGYGSQQPYGGGYR